MSRSGQFVRGLGNASGIRHRGIACLLFLISCGLDHACNWRPLRWPIPDPLVIDLICSGAEAAPELRRVEFR